jgi:hypothetical protein
MKHLFVLLLSLSTLTSIAQDKQQCKGTTTKGVQCKNQQPAQYCRFHNPETPRCGFIKKDGKPCRNTVKVAGQRCHIEQHKK